MKRFTSYDGTSLAFAATGSGPPLVCLPGGPGRTHDYLGDLGGLSAASELVLPDLRGTGESDSADPESYRCDRLVADVEALRAHLGLDRIGLLGHSAGADLAVLYAAAHPDRVARLVLLTPGVSALGINVTDEQQRAAMARRSGEPWYAAAVTAVEKADAGDDSIENRQAYLPFFYGRWDEAAQAHARSGTSERVRAFVPHYYAGGAFDPEATRAALRRLTAPVIIYAGGLDIGLTAEVAAEAAALFPRAEVVVQPGAGHFPWLEDPGWFSAAMAKFLS